MAIKKLRHEILSLFLIILAVSAIPQAKAVNCLDYALSIKGADGELVYGYYQPAKQGHVWIKQGGLCFDNMNKLGFNCDDIRYVEWPFIDLSDNATLFKILLTRV